MRQGCYGLRGRWADNCWDVTDGRRGRTRKRLRGVCVGVGRREEEGEQQCGDWRRGCSLLRWYVEPGESNTASVCCDGLVLLISVEFQVILRIREASTFLRWRLLNDDGGRRRGEEAFSNSSSSLLSSQFSRFCWRRPWRARCALFSVVD